MAPIRFLIITLLLVFTHTAQADLPCESEAHRAFDFWVGSWTVTRADGNLAGKNHIMTALNGCLLEEHYTTAGGYEGKSTNHFNPKTGLWHQRWIDNAGLILDLAGNVDEQGNMVLFSTRDTTKTQTDVHRITWTPLADGKIRQHWQYSQDDGANWQSLFDGIYSKQDDTSPSDTVQSN